MEVAEKILNGMYYLVNMVCTLELIISHNFFQTIDDILEPVDEIVEKAIQEAVTLAMADISYREECRTSWDPVNKKIIRKT